MILCNFAVDETGSQHGRVSRLLVDLRRSYASSPCTETANTSLSGVQNSHARSPSSRGIGSLEFAFYNPPAVSVREQIRFLLTPCSLQDTLITDSACTTDRAGNATGAAAFAREQLFFSGLLGGNTLAVGAASGEVAQQFQEASEAGQEFSGEDIAGYA